MNKPNLTDEERKELKQQEANLIANVRHYRKLHEDVMMGPDTIQAERDQHSYWSALTKAEEELMAVSLKLYGR